MTTTNEIGSAPNETIAEKFARMIKAMRDQAGERENAHGPRWAEGWRAATNFAEERLGRIDRALRGAVPVACIDARHLQLLRQGWNTGNTLKHPKDAGEGDVLLYAHAPPAPAASVPDGWQKIETAPKDGTEIQGWREDQGVFVFRWAAAEDFVARDSHGDPIEEYDEYFACWWHDRWGWMEHELTPTLWAPLLKEPTTPEPTNADDR